MDVSAFLQAVQAHPLYRGQLVHQQLLPERPGRYAAPQQPLPDVLQQLLLARHPAALFASGRGTRGGAARPGPGRGHRHCQRQDAVLQPADPGSLFTGSAGAGAVSVPDQSLGAGPVEGPVGAVLGQPRRVGANQAGSLRRRHAHRAAPSHQGRGAVGAVQSGHAARVDSALSSQVAAVLQPVEIRRAG